MENETGPWEARRDTGYAAHKRQWVVKRRNRSFWGGEEILQTRAFRERRFASEEKAKQVADALNVAQNVER